MKKRLKDRGTALLIAIVVVIMVVGIGGALFVDSTARFQRQNIDLKQDEAQIIADAMFEKARRALWKYRNDNTWNWDDILSYCNGITTDADLIWQMYLNVKDTPTYVTAVYNNTAAGYYTANEDPLPANLSTWSASDWTNNGVILGHMSPFGKAGVHVTVEDNSDEPNLTIPVPDDPLADVDLHVFVTVTVCMQDGTQRQVRGLVKFDRKEFKPPGAVTVNGDISLSGNFTIDGVRGTVHANGDVVFGDGTTTQPGTVEVGITATGSVIGSPGNTPTEGIESGGEPPDIPDIQPSALQSESTVTLTSSGTVIDNATGADLTGTAGYDGFTYDSNSGTWSLSGKVAVAPEFYYIEGNFSTSGQGNEFERYMTVVATGSVNMTGNFKMAAYRTDINDPATSNNLLVVAGGDVTVAGTSQTSTSSGVKGGGTKVTNVDSADVTRQGIIYAREQIKISGTPNIIGAVVGGNFSDQFNDVTNNNDLAPDATAAGNPVITYDGLGSTVVINGTTVDIQAYQQTVTRKVAITN